jgi:hypothetical protein
MQAAADAVARRSVRGPSVAAVSASGSQSVAAQGAAVSVGRSSRAPSVMVRPGRKTWVQVYEDAVGDI